MFIPGGTLRLIKHFTIKHTYCSIFVFEKEDIHVSYNADIFKKFYVCGNGRKTENVPGNRTAENRKVSENRMPRNRKILKEMHYLIRTSL